MNKNILAAVLIRVILHCVCVRVCVRYYDMYICILYTTESLVNNRVIFAYLIVNFLQLHLQPRRFNTLTLWELEVQCISIWQS